MLCCLNPYCDGNPDANGVPNPVNPDGAKRCQYCKEPLIPLLRNRFKPLQVLGQGGFGRTYLAQDRDKLDRPCVVKQLLPQRSSKAVELFQREAEQLETLGQDNPQIPSLIAFFQENNALFLVQQFVEGQSLSRELEQKGIWSEPQVRQLLQGVLPVLDFIHQKGVIHRDLKPDNLMRRKDTGQIVLIDFGLSKQLKGSVLAMPGTRAGSYGYVPLEQMERGEAYPASDLFSLGATCFHLLSGIAPHGLWVRQGYGWVSRWQSHIKQTLSPELTRVLDKLLREDHTRRYQSAQQVLRKLDQVPIDPVPTTQTVAAPPRPIDPVPTTKTITVPPRQPPKPPKREAPPKVVRQNAQVQGLPILWLVGVGVSYGLVGLWQSGGEQLVAELVKGNGAADAVLFTRIFWGIGITVLGSLTGPLTKKKDSIVVSVAWDWAWAWAWVGAWAWAWAVAWAVAWVGAWAWAWAWAGAGAWAGAWAGAGAWVWALALDEAEAGVWAYFGTQLWISILSYLWAIQHPENPVRWRSWLMAGLSLLGGGFCFYQANQFGELILPGVILGAGVMGIIALVIATLVGSGKHLAAMGLSYWHRLLCFAIPALLGVTVGWHSYGLFPWADGLIEFIK
jgi:hypothetical protein